MPDYQVTHYPGQRGDIALHQWSHPQPTVLVLLVHGYGEHLGRYHHVAKHLGKIGALVFGPDHQGHGQSQGERALIANFEEVVADAHQAVSQMQARYPQLPLVVIGHSMGGMIATRYAQRYPQAVDALVLSGPLLGDNTQITALADLAEIPDDPLDTSTLSRNPQVGRDYQADPLVWHGPFKRPMLQAMRDSLAQINAGPGFGSLPVFWLHGADDQLVRVEETRRALNRLRGSDFAWHHFAGAQHEIFNETNQDEVLRHVSSFIVRTVG